MRGHFLYFIFLFLVSCGGPASILPTDIETNEDPPESGCKSSITLAWDPNPESDIGGYKVYIGNTSRNYFNFLDAGNVTQYKVTDLQCASYYFAVTAYNTSSLESDYSNEVTVTMSNL